MTSFRTAFPSKYIKAEDLGATRPIGTISRVTFEDVGSGTRQERKLVVQFAEDTLKPMVLNMINSETIAEIAGTDDYEQWDRLTIQLYATRTEFQGKRVPCIRVCAPPVGAAKRTAASGPRRDDPDDPLPGPDVVAEVL